MQQRFNAWKILADNKKNFPKYAIFKCDLCKEVN